MCSRKSPCKPRTPTNGLDATAREKLLLGKRHDRAADHRLAETAAYICEHGWIVVVGRCLHDRSGALCRIAGFEDSRANEHTINAKLHEQRGIRRRCKATGGEIYNRKFSAVG